MNGAALVAGAAPSGNAVVVALQLDTVPVHRGRLGELIDDGDRGSFATRHARITGPGDIAAADLSVESPRARKYPNVGSVP